MWVELGAIGVAATTAGALIPRATREWFLGDVAHDWLAGELELDRIEPDGVTVLAKDGFRFRVFTLRGIAYDARVEADQSALMRGRAAFLHAAGSLGVTVYLYAVKRREPIGFAADWPSPALAEIGEAERRAFRSSHTVTHYLVLGSKDMRPLAEASAKAGAMLSEYRLSLLSQPEELDAPCALTGFLNGLVSGDYRRDLSPVSSSLSGRLSASDLDIDRRSGLVTAWTPAPKVHRVIAMREWPESVSGRLARALLALPGDIELSQACLPLDPDHARVVFKRKRAEQRAAFIGNAALGAELDAAVELVSEGHTTFFKTQMQLIVGADTLEALDELTHAAARILGAMRIGFSVETAGAPLCWFARLPRTPRKKTAVGSRLLRPLTLRDENVAALWPVAHSPTGLTKSPFGDRPVRFLATPSGQAYAFQFHVSPQPQSVGNYLLFAPTGAGKSTLMLHLLGGLSKFEGVRSYLFDSKEGARFMVEALGGVYQGYEALALNPLDVGGDTPANRHRIHSILRAMAPEAGTEDEEALEHAVALASTLEPPERTLNALFEYAFARGTPLRQAFARWVTDAKGREGLNAHVMNAPHDSLSAFLGQSHLVGVNMNEALDDPVVGPPVVAHVAHAVSGTVARGGQGFCIFIDEAAKLLQNEGFRALAVEMYREYRKLNGVVGMAFQDPAALFRSGSAEAFLENTATLLFLPNSLATVKGLEPFNLNDEQLGFILGGPYQDERAGKRQVLIVKRDAASGLDESAIVDVDLNPLEKVMRFYRAGAEANRDLAQLKRQYGDQWRDHL